MVKVFVSIGSNLERERHLPEAIQEMEKAFGPLTVSSIYESEAEDFEGPSFHNLVVAFETDLSVEEVQRLFKQIEQRHGRSPRDRKFVSRTLDLDLLLYGDLILDDPKTGKRLLPREDILLYAFVLEPLAEIAPQQQHPILGKSYQELWQSFDRSKVRQRKL